MMLIFLICVILHKMTTLPFSKSVVVYATRSTRFTLYNMYIIGNVILIFRKAKEKCKKRTKNELTQSYYITNFGIAVIIDSKTAHVIWLNWIVIIYLRAYCGRYFTNAIKYYNIYMCSVEYCLLFCLKHYNAPV